MKTEDPREAMRQSLRASGLCLAMILALIGTQLALAQDLKTVSSSLSSRIAASGRKTVAVIDFTDLQGNVTELGRFLAEELSVDLVNDARGFEVIDRTHLKSILQEHKLATTGVIDPQTARKLGQIAGVDGLVIIPLGDSVRLSVKVLDTSTAKMIAASTVEVPKTKAIEDLLARGIGGTQTGGPEAAPSASMDASAGKIAKPVSVEENRVLFILKGCWRSGRTVSCDGSVTNKARQRRSVDLGWNSSAVDDLGDQYVVPDDHLALGSGGQRQDLEPDLPVNFSLQIDDVNSAANRVTIVLGYGTGTQGSIGGGATIGMIVGGGKGAAVGGAPDVRGAKLVFKNVPIQQR